MRIETKFTTNNSSLSTKFTTNSSNFPTEIDVKFVASADTESYLGETTITPKAYMAQILPTKNKTLLEDVKVEEIPISETNNSSGGLTLYIGV